jgi:UDP-2,3-diacylglucosamine pyrophosphatase LpxH
MTVKEFQKDCHVNKIIVILVLLIGVPAAFAQKPSFKIFLAGDAGDNELTGETLDSLKHAVLASDNSALIFLGDNSYKNALFGLAPYGFKGFDSSRTTQHKVKSQMDIVNGYAGSVYFIPGNHDWWNLTDFAEGKKKLKMEEGFIEKYLKKNKTIANPETPFLPKDGTPGPVSVTLADKKVNVIFIDTYWLILLGFKKTPAENYTMEKIFYRTLDSMLAVATAQKQKILVVAHHPVYAIGSHAEPLKHPNVLRRIKASNRNYPSYNKMAMQLTAIFNKYPGMYYASGHIHGLQYHVVDSVHYVVSGSGSKTHHVSKNRLRHTSPCTENACMVWNEKGFFEIDYYDTYETVMLHHCNGRKICSLSEPKECSCKCK